MKRKGRPILEDESETEIASLEVKTWPDFVDELDEMRALKLHPNLPLLAPPEDDEENVGIDGPGIQNAIALCVICAFSVVLVGLLLGWPFLQSLFAGTALSLFGLVLFWLVLLLNR